MESKRFLRLAEKARRGNTEAFRLLIEEKARKILFIATNIMGNKTDGEDAAQEAVIVIGRDITKLKKAESFDPWMYRIVFNVCMKEKIRIKKRNQETTDFNNAVYSVPSQDSTTLPDQLVESAENQETITGAINQLPEHLRLCLLLYYYENFSYREIAETLNVSGQVVANNLYRAKLKLREMLSTGSEDPDTEQPSDVGPVPEAAILKAFAKDEELVVSPDAIAQTKDTAATISLDKPSRVSDLLEGSSKKVTVLLFLILMVGCSLHLPPHLQTPTENISPDVNLPSATSALHAAGNPGGHLAEGRLTIRLLYPS